jgi:branched-chain amino acid transport system substrate-binding protein
MIKQRTKSILAVLVVITGLAAVGVVAATAANQDSAATTITIGVGGPLTGSAAITGKQIVHGAQLAVARINSAGGIKGGPHKGAMLKLKTFDDKDDPQTAATLARQITSDSSLVAYVGSGFSDAAIAQAPVFERANMPFLAAYASANTILQPAKKNVFIVPPTFDAYAYSIANTIASQGIKKIGVIHLTGTYGELIAKYLAQRLTALGIKVVSSQPFNFGDSDFRVQLGKIKSAGAAGLAMVGLVDSDTLILKQAKQVGLNVPAFDPGGIVFSQEFLNAAGSLANGLYGNTPTDPQRSTKAAKALIGSYKAKYGTSVVPDPAAFAYEGIQAVATALGNGANGRSDLSSYLHKIHIPDTGIGPLSFSSGGARLGGRLWIFTIKNKHFVFKLGYEQVGLFKVKRISLER